MPSAFGDDSDLCRMLRLLAPQFEHRLFLSATPHNGHTRCFTGLLEILDPVRFSQTDALKPAEKERVQQVVLRRLKREINARSSSPKFCTRHPPQALVLQLSPQEIALSAAFDAFRDGIRKLMGSRESRRRRAGSFAVEILGKRLLSCPTAFAESWRRCKEGLAEQLAAAESDVEAARRTVERDTDDDREAQSREATAAGVVGAWLKAVAAQLEAEIAAIDGAIAAARFDLGRNDLASQDLFDEAAHRRLVEGESAVVVQADLDRRVAAAPRSTPMTRPTPAPRDAPPAISSRRSPPRSILIPARSGKRSKPRWRSAPGGRSSTARRPRTPARS